MRRLLLPLLATLALPVAVVAQPRPPAPAATAQANRIVAVVNGDVVSRADIASRTRLFALNIGLSVAPEMMERLAPQVTRLLIDERLRLQEVQRRRIPVSDQDVNAAISDLERRNGLREGGLVGQLRNAGIQPRVLYDQIRTQIGWARLIRVMLGPQAEPSEQDVQDALRNARARVGQPEYLVSEIFIPVDDPRNEGEARRFVEEVIRQLRAGTPFPVAASQFSQAQTALAGGDLGWVHGDQLDPEVASVVGRMPPGAVSNPIRVAGGFQVVALRQKRESGREIATLLNVRQVILPFSGRLDPNNPTQQQRDQVERAQRIAQGLRSCEAADQVSEGGARATNPGPVRLETVNPPPLRNLLAGLSPGRASQPIISPDGVIILMLCSRETRNLAELNAEDAKQQLLRDRVELLSRQLQRDLRRRAVIEMRDESTGSTATAGR